MKLEEHKIEHKIEEIILDGSRWYYLTDLGVPFYVSSHNPGLRVGDTFWEKTYKCFDGTYTNIEMAARSSFDREKFKTRMRAEYAKCKNPISRWWFRFWCDPSTLEWLE